MRRERVPRRAGGPLHCAGPLSVGMLAFMVALVAILLVGCGSDDDSATAGANTSSSLVEAGFSGVTLDGTEVSLSDYRGKPLVLVFMATW